MAKEDIGRDSAAAQAATDARKLKEKQDKTRKMSAEADKKRSITASLFPAEPLPGLIHADNPQGRYDTWYKGLMAFKRLYLKGPAYLTHRDEINKFMKEGKMRGADSRMSSQLLMEEAQTACLTWLAEGGGQDSMKLYLTFCELNKRWVTIPLDGASQ